MMGIPYQYTKAKVLLARLDYLRSKHGIHENEFLAFDALRQTSQCIGRVIRSKTDYGVIILADERYAKPTKKNKLPPWVTKFFTSDTVNIHTGTAVNLTRNFLIQSAQPISNEEMHDSLFDIKKLDEKHQHWLQSNPGIAIARESFALKQQLRRQRGAQIAGGTGNGFELEVQMAEYERDQRILEMMQKEAEEERLEKQFSWDRTPKVLKLFGEVLELDLQEGTLFGASLDNSTSGTSEMAMNNQYRSRGEDDDAPKIKRARHT
jgi:hypothetical protein